MRKVKGLLLGMVLCFGATGAWAGNLNDPGLPSSAFVQDPTTPGCSLTSEGERSTPVGSSGPVLIDLNNAVSGTLIVAPGGSFAQTFDGQTVLGTGISGTPTSPLTLAPSGEMTVAVWESENTILPQPGNTAPLSVLLDSEATSITWRMGSGNPPSDVTIDFFTLDGSLVNRVIEPILAGYNNYTFDIGTPFRGFTIYNNNDPAGLRFFHFGYETGATSLDIKANGQDGPINISPGDPVAITISLDAGDKVGEVADWWIAVSTPFASPKDWYTYVHPIGFMPGVNLCAQTGLFDLAPYEVLNMTLPIGTYTFYFALDGPDYAATGPWWGLDSVEVTVE